MSIFGEMSLDNIPTNPNWVPRGTYTTQLSRAAFFGNDGDPRFVLTFVIPKGEEYAGALVRKSFQVIPNLTEKLFQELPHPDQRRLIELRNLLFGPESYGGMTLPAELSNSPIEELVNYINETQLGRGAVIQVWNGGENNEYVNVGKVRFN